MPTSPPPTHHSWPKQHQAAGPIFSLSSQNACALAWRTVCYGPRRDCHCFSSVPKVLAGAGAGLRSFLAHQSTSYTSLLAKTAPSCRPNFQPQLAKCVHLGMANGKLWPKERLTLLLKCPKSLGKCWGRSGKLPCPPVHLLHITLGQNSTKLQALFSASARKMRAPWHGKRYAMAQGEIDIASQVFLAGAVAGLRSFLAHQSTSYTSLLAKTAPGSNYGRLFFEPA